MITKLVIKQLRRYLQEASSTAVSTVLK